MKFEIKQAFQWMIKGAAMGAANVIPGVSGGTIALITGIFERLINAIKSFDITALKLLFKGKFKEFVKYTDLGFLFFVFIGVGVAIITIARLFEYLFENFPILIWSFFFGLVLASVYFVARKISKWTISTFMFFIVGTAIAVTISFLTPATENSSIWYVMICGVVAACSMILPGLSGSFVLILLGNYQLIMIDAVNKLRWEILIPTVIGAGFGILSFSWVLSWLFKKFRDQTIAVLSGFILGSLGILWPWKNVITQGFGDKVKTVGYDWFFPEINSEFFIAAGIIVLGVVCIWLMEKAAGKAEVKEIK
jgi:putative membrane protein